MTELDFEDGVRGLQDQEQQQVTTRPSELSDIINEHEAVVEVTSCPEQLTTSSTSSLANAKVHFQIGLL